MRREEERERGEERKNQRWREEGATNLERSSQTLVDFGSPPSYHHNTTLSATAETTLPASPFHSSASTVPPSHSLTLFFLWLSRATLPRHRDFAAARFNARFHQNLSFLRLFAGARWWSITSVPYPKRYASAPFFPRRLVFVPPEFPFIFFISRRSP